MGDGLKDQWGVTDPAPAGSDDQSKEFQAAFQGEIGAINGNLQYTAVNAEEARHTPLAARRDALPPAYQSALGSIDPADPAKAKGAIDKVLGDARPLNSETKQFRAEAEKAFNDWQERQPKLEEAVHQVEELEAWGHPKAPPLRALVDGIRGETDKKRYGPASTTLDQFLPKLQPIYEIYLRQRAAKEKYDPLIAALLPRLSKCGESKSVKLAPQQQEIATLQGQMETASQTKEYEQALQIATDLTAKVEAYEAALAELEAQKKAYEEALAALQPRLSKASESQSPKLAPLQQELPALQGQMETAAQGEEYEQATKLAAELATKLDAFEAAVADLEAKKKAYEDALATLQPRLGKTSQSAKLAPLEQELTELQGQMEAAASGEDYDAALKLSTDLTTKLDAYDAAAADLEAKKNAYEEAFAALQPRLGKTSQSPKLAPLEQELTELQDQMEAAAQNEDYEPALKMAGDLATKLDAYDAAVAELEAKKKAYEDALAALQPRLAKAAESQSAKLAPQQQEIADLQAPMEAAAQAEEYEEALGMANNLATKLDAFEAAVADLEAKKKAYEEAMAALQPRLGAAAQSQSAKLAPMQQDITASQEQIEASAQAEEYDQALQGVADLTTKLDTYEAAVAELERQKKEYEDALAELQPRLAATAQSQSAKLTPMQQEIAALQEQMEVAAQSEDYEQALKIQSDLTSKLTAYEAAVAELEAKKKEYEDALATLQPRLTKAAEPPSPKLAAQQQEIAPLAEQMETAAQAEDYDGALQMSKDLTAKLDAYEAAVADLEEKKKAYEDALAPLQPRLDQSAQSQCAKFTQQQQEIADLQVQMKEAAEAEDFEKALEIANDLATKLDAFEEAVEQLEAQKKAYEDALAPLQPRLDKASEPAYPKNIQLQEEIAASQTEMKEAAEAEDYEKALDLANNLATKLDAYEAAVEEVEAKKIEYEEALADLQPRLDKAAEPASPKLEPLQQEIAAARADMEKAAQDQDYDQATELADALADKVGQYEDAVAAEEKKKQEYEAALQALQPRLAKAAEPTGPKLAPLQGEIPPLVTQMETAAADQDYDGALKLQGDLTSKLETYETAVGDLAKQKQEYEAAKADVQSDLDEINQPQQVQIEDKKKEITDLQAKMEAAEKSEDYATALQCVNDLGPKLDDYAAAVAEIEKIPDDMSVECTDGEAEIGRRLDQLKVHIADFWTNYLAGLASFETTMSNSSDEEAEPKYFKAAFKAVGKAAIDMCVDLLAKGLDEGSGGAGAGALVKMLKAAIEAGVAEVDRVAAAQGQVTLRDYIVQLRNATGSRHKAMTDAVVKGEGQMKQDYKKAAEADPSKGKPVDGRIFGEPARIIKGNQQGVEGFSQNIPMPVAFQQEFSTNFANTPGLTDFVSQGGRPAGKLYFEELSLYVENVDGKNRWTVKDASTEWVLVTKQEKPDRVADSLRKSLAGKQIWQVELEKKVKIRVEIEETGLNPIKDGWIFFTGSPDNFDISTLELDPKLLTEAWHVPSARSKVLNTGKLIGRKE